MRDASAWGDIIVLAIPASARYLEALGFLTIQLGYGPTQYGTDIGFKVVGSVGKKA